MVWIKKVNEIGSNELNELPFTTIILTANDNSKLSYAIELRTLISLQLLR